MVVLGAAAGLGAEYYQSVQIERTLAYPTDRVRAQLETPGAMWSRANVSARPAMFAGAGQLPVIASRRNGP